MNIPPLDMDSILDMERKPDNSICDADCRGANSCSGRAFCEECAEAREEAEAEESETTKEGDE